MQLITLALYTALIAGTQAAPNPLQIALSLDIKDTNTAQDPFCLYVCWEENPTCPSGWYSNNKGTGDDPCWTCCRAPLSPPLKSAHPVNSAAVKDHFSTTSTRQDMSNTALTVDVCLAICMPGEPDCGNGWYASRMSGCWTCCVLPTDDSISGHKENILKPAIDDVSVQIKVNDKEIGPNNLQDPCWMVCWGVEPQCPNLLYSNNKGTADEPCWTCCFPPNDKLKSLERLSHRGM